MNAWILYALTAIYVALTVFFVVRYTRYRRKTRQLEAAVQANKVTPAHLQAYLEQIEAQLRSLGCLTGPLAPATVESHAQDADAMPFETWLGLVFLPRAYERLANNTWPANSQLGQAATHSFAGLDDYAELTRLLIEWDALTQAYAALQPRPARHSPS